MIFHRSLFSSASEHWATPEDTYRALDAEFHFNDDPCPLGGSGGLERPWGTSTYVNPPYGRGIYDWLAKATHERLQGKTIVFLLPARTDTRWFHDIVLPQATEIRFIRGRLRFGGSKNSAPFPSMIIVFS
jgi:site-specific DNA-methyltransferase (adenine-specific)